MLIIICLCFLEQKIILEYIYILTMGIQPVISQKSNNQASNNNIQMLIQKKQQQPKIKELKHQVFQLFHSLNHKCQNNSLMVSFAIDITLIPAYLSLNFNFLMPPQNDGFTKLSYFLPSYYIRSFPSYKFSMLLFFNLFLLLFSCIGVSFFFLRQLSQAHLKILKIMVNIIYYLIYAFVDIFSLCFSEVNLTSSISQSIMLSTFLILFIPALIFIGFYLIFAFNPLRKDNKFWKLDNKIEIKRYIYTILKSFYISLWGHTQGVIFLSLLFWYIQTQVKNNDGCLLLSSKIVQLNFFNYLAATDFSILVWLLTSNSSISLLVWVFSISFFIIHGLMQIINLNSQPFFLPKCQDPPEAHYNFYFQAFEQFKSKDLVATNHRKYYPVLHQKYCQQKCDLNRNYEGLNIQAAMKAVNYLVQSKKNKSMRDQLIYLLWNKQSGKKCKCFHLYDKQLTIEQQFIIFCLQVEQVIVQDAQHQKNKDRTILFLENMSKLATNYQQFYSELSKMHPCIDSVIYNGQTVINHKKLIEKQYKQLIKAKLLTHQINSIYNEVYTVLLKKTSKDKSFKQIQNNPNSLSIQNISEYSFPTFIVQQSNLLIHDCNCEGVKLLKSTKRQLKYKKIIDFLIPRPKNLQQKLQKIDNQLNEAYSFFKTSLSDYYQFGKIQFSEKKMLGIRYILVQVIRMSFHILQNQILVNNNFELLLMTKRKVRVNYGKFSHCPLKLDWKQLFDQYVFPNKQLIISKQTVKIQTNYSNMTIMISKHQCLSQSNFIIILKLIACTNKRQRSKKTNNISYVIKQSRAFSEKSRYCFNYGDDDEVMITLVERVLRQQINEKRRHRRNTKYLSTMIQNRFRVPIDLGQNIRTYRLYKGDLYNIDLQDKQAYTNEVQGLPEPSKFRKSKKNGHNHTVIFVFIFFGALITLSVWIWLEILNSQQLIAQHEQSLQNINIFQTNFSRLVTLLRDWSNGLANLYPEINFLYQIKISKNVIEHYMNGSSLFDSSHYSMPFQNIYIEGTLNELVRVILAHVDQISFQIQEPLIEDIHTTCILVLNPMIDSYTNNLRQDITQAIANIKRNMDIFQYSLICIFVCLQITFCLFVKELLRINIHEISPIMRRSSSFLMKDIANADIIKHKIELICKGLSIDIQFEDNVQHKIRVVSPKKTQLSMGVILLISLGLGLVVILFLSTQIWLFNYFDTEIIYLAQMNKQTEYLTSIYSHFCQLANHIDHLQQINFPSIQIIKQHLYYIEQNIQNLSFSNELNQIILTLYFSNSCTYLNKQYGLTQAKCKNLARGFTIVNPFQLGLSPYYNRQIYYMAQNVTESYSFTGIFSQYFVKIYTDLGERLKTQTIDLTQSLFDNTIGIIIGVNAITVLTAIIFYAIYTYFNRQLIKIIQIVDFFRGTDLGEEIKQPQQWFAYETEQKLPSVQFSNQQE